MPSVPPDQVPTFPDRRRPARHHDQEPQQSKHEMVGRMQYLVGSAHELGAVWKAWGVGSERDAKQPEFVNHSGLIYGITGSGKRLTIYASSFRPSDIVHDVPLLVAR